MTPLVMGSTLVFKTYHMEVEVVDCFAIMLSNDVWW
jgi:hypothetical protein